MSSGNPVAGHGEDYKRRTADLDELDHIAHVAYCHWQTRWSWGNGHGSAWAEGLADSIFFYKLEAYIEQKDCQIAAQTYVCLIASFTGDSSVSAVGPRPGLSCLLHGVELLKSPKPRKSTKHMHPGVDFSFPSRCSLDCSWRFNLKRTLIFLVTLVNFPTTWHGCCFKGLPLFAQRTRLYRRSRTRASSSLHSTSIGMGM